VTRRHRMLIALGLGLATTTLLSLGHRDVGYVRDEGIYFLASRHHAAWAANLLRTPGTTLAAPARDRAFRINNEHPALMKLAGGISARLLAAPGVANTVAGNPPEPAPAGLLPLMPEGAAMRLPAQLLAGLAVALLFLAGAALAAPPVPKDSPTEPVPSDTPNLPLLAGLCAALWFIALPHVWFHAGLHCFDVPVAAATLAVVLIYRRALHSWRWALALGPALGVAISIKHNALFIPVLLGLHYLVTLALARRRPSRSSSRSPSSAWRCSPRSPCSPCGRGYGATRSGGSSSTSSFTATTPTTTPNSSASITTAPRSRSATPSCSPGPPSPPAPSCSRSPASPSACAPPSHLSQETPNLSQEPPGAPPS
jgi:hypothetical protein